METNDQQSTSSLEASTSVSLESSHQNRAAYLWGNSTKSWLLVTVCITLAMLMVGAFVGSEDSQEFTGSVRLLLESPTDTYYTSAVSLQLENMQRRAMGEPQLPQPQIHLPVKTSKAMSSMQDITAQKSQGKLKIEKGGKGSQVYGKRVTQAESSDYSQEEEKEKQKPRKVGTWTKMKNFFGKFWHHNNQKNNAQQPEKKKSKVVRKPDPSTPQPVPAQPEAPAINNAPVAMLIPGTVLMGPKGLYVYQGPPQQIPNVASTAGVTSQLPIAPKAPMIQQAPQAQGSLQQQPVKAQTSASINSQSNLGNVRSSQIVAQNQNVGSQAQVQQKRDLSIAKQAKLAMKENEKKLKGQEDALNILNLYIEQHKQANNSEVVTVKKQEVEKEQTNSNQHHGISEENMREKRERVKKGRQGEKEEGGDKRKRSKGSDDQSEKTKADQAKKNEYENLKKNLEKLQNLKRIQEQRMKELEVSSQDSQNKDTTDSKKEGAKSKSYSQLLKAKDSSYQSDQEKCSQQQRVEQGPSKAGKVTKRYKRAIQKRNSRSDRRDREVEKDGSLDDGRKATD